MQNKTLAISVIFAALVLIGACKKDSGTAAKPGNVPHAITDSFYYRALYDTTWIYHGDGNKGECNRSSGLCSSFLYDATFVLSDSANPHPHDSIIRSWVGKTFVTSGDTADKAYTFSFSFPDSLGTLGTNNARNIGSRLTVTSVDSNGYSTINLDTARHGYRFYKVKGTFTANVAHYNDTLVHSLNQGTFSINVMESKQP